MQLFASSGFESDKIAQLGNLANEMGLFLQKTNIIRDYLASRLSLCHCLPITRWLACCAGGHQRAASSTHVVAAGDLGPVCRASV